MVDAEEEPQWQTQSTNVTKRKSKHAKIDSIQDKNQPSGHMALIQRRLNVNATSWRCIDVETTLYSRHVPAGKEKHKNQFPLPQQGDNLAKQLGSTRHKTTNKT